MNSSEKFNTNLSKGFTLIELLVVVAIIGILSSVVLASLSTARNKGSDAAIKADLVNMRTQAALYYDSNGNYGTASYQATCPHTSNTQAVTYSVFTDPNVKTALTQAGAQAGGVLSGTGAVAMITKTYCYSSDLSLSQPEGWAAVSQLKTNNTSTWCVDSNGASKTFTIVADTPLGAINVSTSTTSPTCK